MVTAVKGKLTDQTQSSVCTNKPTPSPAATKASFFFMLLQKMQFTIKKKRVQNNRIHNRMKPTFKVLQPEYRGIACLPLLAEIKKNKKINTCLSSVWI